MKSIIYIFLLTLLLFGCKKTNKHNKNVPKNKNITLLKPITNFLFFKTGMTSGDVEKELLKRKIEYKFKNDRNYVFENININSFNSYHKIYNLKVLKGKSLKILSYEIKDFELGFVNDTLTVFRYYHISEEPEAEYVYPKIIDENGETVIDITNKHFSDNWHKANSEYKKNGVFFKEYYYALKEKYGKCDKIIGDIYDVKLTEDNEFDFNKFWINYKMMLGNKSDKRGLNSELVYYSLNNYLTQRDWSNDIHNINISLKRREVREMFREKNKDAEFLPYITIIDITANFKKHTLKKVFDLHKKQLKETTELNNKIVSNKMKMKRKKELDSL
ncbi:hypothetical protein [Flavobacterium sp.]|uniref:hypothetical protein n=1 Tax=Flavobacterium sp. TaxID=239 RepID=UPI00333EE709